MKDFAFLVAALVVLVGFSGAVITGPWAVTKPAVSGTETTLESAFGGNTLTAGDDFGGEARGRHAQLLLPLEITTADDLTTRSLFVEMATESLLIAEFTAIVEHAIDEGLGRRVRVEGTTSATWTDLVNAGDTVLSRSAMNR